MNATKLIEILPTSVKQNVIDFTPIKIKDNSGNIKNAIRVTLDKILSDTEKQRMQKNKRFVGLDCITYYRYAPEIRYSYFYVVI